MTFLLLGGLVALDVKLSLRATTALAALLGLYHGYLDGAGMGQPGFASVACWTRVRRVHSGRIGRRIVVHLQAAWARIAVRVVGSWVVASGLLMLGWSLHGKL